MTAEAVDAQERVAFVKWRRELAQLEESERLVLTPFEKNLEVWRQLWRVLERSHIVVQVCHVRTKIPDCMAHDCALAFSRRHMLVVPEFGNFIFIRSCAVQLHMSSLEALDLSQQYVSRGTNTSEWACTNMPMHSRAPISEQSRHRWWMHATR